MKFQFLFKLGIVIAAILFAAVSVSAQPLTMCGGGTGGLPTPWVQVGDDIYYDVDNGNVGIGTDAPEETLHVNGSVRFETLASCGRFVTDADGTITCAGTSACGAGEAVAGLNSDGSLACVSTGSGSAPESRTIATTAPLSGGGDLSADRTLSITQADTTTAGYLSAADWNAFDGKQPGDSTLSALAAYNTNGIVAQTAADTFVGREIEGTANQVEVTNGDGVAGNPTLSLPQDIHEGASPTFAGMTVDGSSNYKISESSTPGALGISNQETGQGATVVFSANDKDGSDGVTLALLSKLDNTDPDNPIMEYGTISYDNSQFRLSVGASGGGAVNPLYINTQDNDKQLYLGADGRVGFGTDTPQSKFHIVNNAEVPQTLNVEYASASTNENPFVLNLYHSTSQQAANNIGVAMGFFAENDGGTVPEIGSIGVQLIDATADSEDSAMNFVLANNGQIINYAQLQPSIGQFQIGNDGASGGIMLYSEQGNGVNDDYTVSIKPNTAMTNFYTLTLPADGGMAGQVLVNTTGNGQLDWADFPDTEVAWGDITGTLSNQADLQSALDAKVASARTVTATAPLSGGGDLSANRTLSITQSGAAADGYLSSVDWNTFNNKTGTSRTIATTLPLSGGGDLSANRTLSITQSGAATDGYLSSVDWNTFNNKIAATRTVATTAPLTGGGDLSANRTVSITQSGAATDGYLSSVDWNTFNNKQAAGSYLTALTGDVTATGPGSAAATIANDAVTYAKMQNVSATDKVLGRSSASAGDMQEITFSDFAQDFSQDTVADDQIYVGDSATAGTFRSVPNCTDSSGSHLNYTAASNSFSCGTSSSGITDLTGEVTASGSGSVAATIAAQTSATWAGKITNETGTGLMVFNNSPTFITPALGTPASGVATNLTGLPLTTGVTGTLPIGNGGTNTTSFGANRIPFINAGNTAFSSLSTFTFDGTSALSLAAAGASFTLGTSGGGSSNIFIGAGVGGNPRLRLKVPTGSQTVVDEYEMFVNGDDFGLKTTGGSGGTRDLMTIDGTTGNVVYNDVGTDSDFTIESDTDTNAFHMDGQYGRVGIGTASPEAKLHINAGTNETVSEFGGLMIEAPTRANIFFKTAENGSHTASLWFNGSQAAECSDGNPNNDSAWCGAMGITRYTFAKTGGYYTNDGAGNIFVLNLNAPPKSFVMGDTGEISFGAPDTLGAKLGMVSAVSSTTANNNTYAHGILFNGDLDLSDNNAGTGIYQMSAIWPTNEAAAGGGLALGTRPASGSMTERVRILSTGRVGIGTTNPSYLLELPNVATSTGGQGRANAWVTYSDARFKVEREKVSQAVEKIKLLNPLYYKWQNTTHDEDGKIVAADGVQDKREIGFLAQEVYQILPEVVYKPANEDTDMWSLNYEKLTPLLVTAMQEQQVDIDKLKEDNKRIDKLESEVAELKAKLEELANRNN